MKILLPIHDRSKLLKEQTNFDVDIKPIREWSDISEYDLAIPLSFNQIDAFMKSGFDLSKSLLPNRFAFQLCNNKLALNSYLIQNGMGQHIPELFPETYPMIYKPNIGIASEGVTIIRDEAHYIDMGIVLKEGFYQEFISGSEYSINCIIVDNKVVFSGNYNYNEDYMKIHGMLHHQEFDDRVKLIEQGENSLVETTVQEKEFIETVCRVIDYGNGIMHLGYRMKGGVKQLIEINPRWSATSMFYMEEMVEKLHSILS